MLTIVDRHFAQSSVCRRTLVRRLLLKLDAWYKLHKLSDKPGVAVLLNNLGIVARFQRDLTGARQMNEESLALFRELGDRWATGQLLNNQACVASDQGDYAEARALLQESLSIRRQLGDKAGLALSLNTLADVMLDEGDYASVRPLLDESLTINYGLGDQTAIAYVIEDYAGLAAESQPEQALRLAGFAAALREAIEAPHYRGDRRAPGWLASVASGLIGLMVSALLVGAPATRYSVRASATRSRIWLVTAAREQ
jgi:tetratricopeptide (TPR) repeat protein